MGLGNILFAEQEEMSPNKKVNAWNAPGARPITGDEKVLKDLLVGDMERPVMPKQAALPSLTEDEIRQAVPVIPDHYWNMNCWTSKFDGH